MRKAAEGRGRPRKAAEGRGRPRKAAEGHGRPRKAAEGRGRPRKSTEGWGSLRDAMGLALRRRTGTGALRAGGCTIELGHAAPQPRERACSVSQNFHIAGSSITPSFADLRGPESAHLSSVSVSCFTESAQLSQFQFQFSCFAGSAQLSSEGMLFRPETSCPKEWRSWGCVESPGRRGKRQPPAEDYCAPQKMLRAVENTNAEGGEDAEDVEPGGTAWKVVEGCGGRWNTGEDAGVPFMSPGPRSSFR
eukprot:gene13956-biopygen11695